MINLTDFIDIEDEVKVTLTDGRYIIGVIGSVEDEEESELGEIGISFYSKDGGYIGIGQSEIKSIDIL